MLGFAQVAGLLMVIRKLPGENKWRLYSVKAGRNLGTYPTRAGAVNRERQVEFFKRHASWKK
jgi:hypothetical protein